MDNLIFSLNGVMPIFLVMVLGWLLKRFRILNEGFFSQASKYVFAVAIPAMLFDDIISSDFYSCFDFRFIFTAVGVMAAYIILLWIFIPIFIKDRNKTGALIQVGYRSNFAILGLPLAKNILDAAGAAKTGVLLAFIIPLFNISAVICLSYWSSAKRNYREMFFSILKNPLITGSLAGLVVSVFDIHIPVIAARTVKYVGDTGMGLGLIVLGASFAFENFRKNSGYIAFGAALKTVVSPLFGVIIMYLLGYRGEDIAVIFLLFGSSTAINSYIMAREMNSDAELTSGAVVATTALSILTLFVGIFILKTLNFI